MKLVLSIFSGIDLLGKAFHEAGFCVVKAGDLYLDGSDIRGFHAPKNKFDGIIGGSPCQDFSKLNRNKKSYGFEMLKQYQRVVGEASPDWYLFENVVGVPEFEIEGYTNQRFTLDLAWFTPFSRLRVFQFGAKNGTWLNPMIGVRREIIETAVTGSDTRSFSAMCEIQGLPKTFDLPFLSLQGKKKAVGNGVPMQLGKYLAGLINRDYYNSDDQQAASKQQYNRCLCGCGRAVTGRAKYSGATCRKRAQRERIKKKQAPNGARPLANTTR